ncbi:MAG: hypothetical protein U0359_07615 [Byssovorax sp.]
MTPAEKAEFDRWAATVPVGEEDMSPEQQAEFARIAAEFEAGRARMVAHADVPAALEEMARARAA